MAYKQYQFDLKFTTHLCPLCFPVGHGAHLYPRSGMCGLEQGHVLLQRELLLELLSTVHFALFCLALWQEHHSENVDRRPVECFPAQICRMRALHSISEFFTDKCLSVPHNCCKSTGRKESDQLRMVLFVLAGDYWRSFRAASALPEDIF